MNTNQLAMLNLLKQSQFDCLGKRQSNNKLDGEKLYREALYHGVLGLVAPEVPLIFSDHKWQQANCTQSTSFIKYCSEEEGITELLQKASISFVIINGNSTAINYRDPSRRALGEIDILVLNNHLSNAKSVLESAGCVYIGEDNECISFARNQYKINLYHSYCHSSAVDKYVVSNVSNAINVRLQGHVFPVLPVLANGLLLLDNISAKLMTNPSLQQIIDWMMYVYWELSDEFWNNEFRIIVREYGMETVAILVTRMCQLYLGLPDSIKWCYEADEIECKHIMEWILISNDDREKNERIQLSSLIGMH